MDKCDFILEGIILKKMYLVFGILCIFLLTGCSNSIQNEENYPQSFLSDKANHYSILFVSDKDAEWVEWQEWKDKNNIRNVKGITQLRTTLEEINEEYKFLELEKKPAFVVFGIEDMVLKTYDENELITFLKSKVPEDWNY